MSCVFHNEIGLLTKCQSTIEYPHTYHFSLPIDPWSSETQCSHKLKVLISRLYFSRGQLPFIWCPKQAAATPPSKSVPPSCKFDFLHVPRVPLLLQSHCHCLTSRLPSPEWICPKVSLILILCGPTTYSNPIHPQYLVLFLECTFYPVNMLLDII